ncbi:MAG: glycosyltransferase [Candidatus Andersenbacteria bacterium]|nr:glycosyltransferase [Candidatus Andersenbacteria bacterium]
MRIGIDAHIILKEHKRYDPRIARYTEQLITHLLKADVKREHTWVLFFDERMKESRKLQRFRQPNVEIKHFPFVQYRRFLPVVYSHMLISSFLTAARLDVFHSPEGLIPYLYLGKIVTTFHYVPKGESDSNLFVRTFMLGARVAFAGLCRRAKRIIVNSESDKTILVERHGYPAARVVVMAGDAGRQTNWPRRVKELLKLYRSVAEKSPVSDLKRKTPVR